MKYYAIYSTVSVDNAQNAQVLRDAFPMDKEIDVTTSYNDAVKIARDGREGKKQQYPIYEITTNGKKGTHADTLDLANGEVINIFKLTPNDAKDFQLVSASLAHVNKKYKAVDLTAKVAKPSVSSEEEVSPSKDASNEDSKDASKDASNEDSNEDSKASKSASEEKSSAKEEPAKKDEDKKTEENKAEDAKKADEKKDEDTQKASSSYVTAASAVAGVGIVATGFWFSGFYPSAVALLAKAGLTIPAAAVAAQVGVSLAVGIAVVGVLALGYYGISKLFGSSEVPATDEKTKEVENRTEDQKYHDDLKAKQDLTAKLAEHFTSKADKQFLVEFDKVLDLDHTAERKFKNGELMKKQPAATDKLVAFGFKAKMLAKIDALTGKDRTAKEAEVLAEANTRVKAKSLHRAL